MKDVQHYVEQGTKQNALDRGYDAYKMGVPEDKCPYKTFSEEWQDWQEGWNVARRAELYRTVNSAKAYKFPR